MPTIHRGVVSSIGKMIKTCTVTVTYYREVPKILKVGWTEEGTLLKFELTSRL